MNDKSKTKDIFFNRADLEKSERVVCDNCFEHMVFMLSDSQQNKFSLGLSTVLQCLTYAVSTGDLPKLPLSWLAAVDNVYDTALAAEENISYNDYQIKKKRDSS